MQAVQKSNEGRTVGRLNRENRFACNMVAAGAALVLFSFGLCVSLSRGQGIMGKPVPVRSTARKTVEWKCEHPGNIDDGFANPPFDKVR